MLTRNDVSLKCTQHGESRVRGLGQLTLWVNVLWSHKTETTTAQWTIPYYVKREVLLVMSGSIPHDPTTTLSAVKERSEADSSYGIVAALQ
jgi:hypothetical protein